LRLVDSHCHLQTDRFDADVEQVISAARLAGIERLLVPGWDVASSEDALALVDRFPWLDAAVGIHPHNAAAIDDAGFARIESLAGDERVVAVGETGLDFDRMFAPAEAQLHNLRRNLALATELGKPAIIHCRSAAGTTDAHEGLLAELDSAGIGGASVEGRFGGRPPALVHSYSGPVWFARAVLERGLAVSFSGLVFRAGEEPSADAARLVPDDRVLVETDAPFLSPPGAPRKRNAPEWVGITARWLAERRNEKLESVGDALVATYDRIFRKGRRPR
jgi:TatD DNase family protein